MKSDRRKRRNERGMNFDSSTLAGAANGTSYILEAEQPDAVDRAGILVVREMKL
jgi:hypothetical protein